MNKRVNVRFNEINNIQDIMYLAGVIDAAGVFGFGKYKYRKKNGVVYDQWTINLIVYASYRGLVMELNRIVGGDREFLLRGAKCNLKNCKLGDARHYCKSRWQCNGKVLRHVLEVTHPFIKGPVKRARIILDILRTMNSSHALTGVPPEIQKRREELLAEWKLLKTIEGGRYKE